jgi:DNA-binding transcriptional regulator YiaG
LEALESIPQTIPNALADVRNFARHSRFGQNLNFQENVSCNFLQSVRARKKVGYTAEACHLMQALRRKAAQRAALSGLSESFLEAAESASLQVTDDDLKALFGVYWELATGEDHPGDFKRLANERLSTPYPEIGSEMREIREQKELSINELSTLSGIPVDILERAESGKVEVTGVDLEAVQRVYWALSALEASPDDYRRLLADIAMKANGD